MFYLTSDISSYNKIIYAKRGDLVRVLADHDNVVIAEKDGVRFPVQKELLSKEKIEKEVEIIKKKK